MTAKEGLDGSGRHAIYDPKGNVETHNMILWMWVPIQVSKDDQVEQPSTSTSESGVIWREGALNSPDAARPILITVGKEDKESLSKVVPSVDKEIEELHKSGVIIEKEEKQYELKIQFHRSMNDGKMQKLLLGRGVKIRILCSFSDQDSVSVEQINPPAAAH